MQVSRLSLALDEGLVLPEGGTLGVYLPRAGYDLGDVPREGVRIVQGFYPDHAAFKAMGYDTQPEPSGSYDAALVVVPRSKPHARAVIADAAARVGTGLIIVDGHKTDGVDSLLKDVRKRTPVIGSIPKAHGRIFWFQASAAFADWDAGPATNADGFQTAPGVFSADGVDPGSALLAQNLPSRLPAKVCDLGAGWGFLSGAILSRDGVQELDIVEADYTALACARANISDSRARFHWADATDFQLGGFDAVVTNPPFHTGRRAEPSLGRAFIASAARLLAPRGELWLVANRHLPYEAAMAEEFRDVREVAGSPAFKVLFGGRPQGHARTRR